jgi:hypothetical protein
MEVLFWLLKWIIGPVLGVIVTLLISEPLKERLAPIVSWLGSKKATGVTGRWEAVFHHSSRAEPYRELIEVSFLFGAVVGRIVPSDINHEDAKNIEKDKPLRIRGSIKDHRFFTGVWFHPSRRSHHHGAFDLIIRQDNDRMDGLWLGYSESSNNIESGRWEWNRIE